ncbi:MAG: hypothetical protein ACE5LU_05990 [Anaerolineae bacterium]
MRNQHIAAILLIVLVLLVAPTPAAADRPGTGLERLVNDWRVERGVQPLRGDDRLYAAAADVAGDGTYCPQDRMWLEFTIAGALYRSGYRERRGYGLLLCGEYRMPQDVMEWIRQHSGPSRRELEEFGIVHLADLNFVRSNGNHVTDIWVLLAADPMD